MFKSRSGIRKVKIIYKPEVSRKKIKIKWRNSPYTRGLPLSFKKKKNKTKRNKNLQEGYKFGDS
jgi:hypothetical protein